MLKIVIILHFYYGLTRPVEYYSGVFLHLLEWRAVVRSRSRVGTSCFCVRLCRIFLSLHRIWYSRHWQCCGWGDRSCFQDENRCKWFNQKSKCTLGIFSDSSRVLTVYLSPLVLLGPLGAVCAGESGGERGGPPQASHGWVEVSRPVQRWR